MTLKEYREMPGIANCYDQEALKSFPLTELASLIETGKYKELALINNEVYELPDEDDVEGTNIFHPVYEYISPTVSGYSGSSLFE